MLPIEISAANRLFLADAGSFGLGLKLLCGVLGQPLGKFIEYRLVSRIVGKVPKFIRVIPVIVKLLRAILINNQPPIATADGVVTKVRRSDRRLSAVLLRIKQLRHERHALEMLSPRQTTKLGQGRIQIDQAGRLFAGSVRLDPWAGDEQRYTRRFLPQSALSPMLFFTQMEPVITP